MKKFSILFLLLCSFSILLAACGTNKANPETAQNNATEKAGEQDLLAKVKDEGKLIIGTEGTYAPFTFHDESGKLTGFDVEIAKEVAKRLGVEAEFLETQWDAMFAGLRCQTF